MKAEEWQHAQRWLDEKPLSQRRYRDGDPETLTEYAREFAAEQLKKAVSIADDVLNTPTILTRFNTATEIKKRLLALVADLRKESNGH